MRRPWISDTPKSITEDSKTHSSPIIKFHTALAERILDKRDNGTLGWKDFLTIKKPKKSYDINAWDSHADRQEERGSFVNGHFLTLRGFTQFPKIMVTLSAKNDKRDAEDEAHEWFLPIEQALLCTTLGEYRESVAILKNWGPYSRFGLVVIPTNTFVSLRMGIVAPQSLPAFHPSYRNKSTKRFPTEYIDDSTIEIRNLVQKAGLDSNLWRFYEALGGGATQFFFAYAYHDLQNRKIECIEPKTGIYGEAKPVKVFEIPSALYQPGDYSFNNAFVPQYTGKIGGKWEPDTLKDTHFFDDSYDRLQIGLHVALQKAVILLPGEYEDIKGILDEIRTVSIAGEIK